MENKNYYKAFQITDILVNKYDFTQIVLTKYRSYMSKEVWLQNNNNPFYQVIRVSFFSASQFVYDEERVNEYTDFFKFNSKKDDIKILDIHINKDVYDKSFESIDYINLEENYYDGINVDNIFPELRFSVKTVSNPNALINDIASRMKEKKQSIDKNKPFLERNKFIFTYALIGISIFIYLLSLLLTFICDDKSAIFILLGADYKTFTLGLNQYNRLLTYAFVHNDIIHLSCNVFSLLQLGKYIEGKFGHAKFLMIFFFSVLCGSLTQGILTTNGLCLGMSAGLYGLMTILVLDAINNKTINISGLIITVIINIGLNFISSTAWIAHLGGLVGGLVMYFAISDSKKKSMIFLCVLLIICLFVKYISISSIDKLYIETDLNVVRLFSNIGFKNKSINLLSKLYNVYSKYGGN